jgi:PKD domain-containing protein
MIRAGLAILAAAALALLAASTAEGEGWGRHAAISVPQTTVYTDQFCDPMGSPCAVYPGVASTAVAMNARGDVAASWARRRDNAEIEDVQAAIRPAGGTFTFPATIGSTNIYKPIWGKPTTSVGIDDAGNAIVVWPQEEGGISRVRASLRAAGGRFGPPITLSPPGEVIASNPRLVVGPRGHTIVAWTGSDASRIRYRSRPPGGSFAPTVTLATGTYILGLDVAINEAGAAVLSWTDDYGSYARVRPAGSATFAATRQLSSVRELGSAGVAQVVIDRQGRTTAVWHEGDGQIKARRLTAAGALGAGTETVNAARHVSIRTSVAANPAGTVVVAWEDCQREGGSGGPRIMCQIAASRSTPSSPFEPPSYVPGSLGATRVQVAVDSAGAATLLYANTVTVRIEPDGTMGTPRLFLRGDFGAGSRALATDGNRSIAVVLASLVPNLPHPQPEVARFVLYDGGPPRLTDLAVPRRVRRAKPVAMRTTVNDVNAVDVRWRFGDGATAAGPSVQHTYTRCGAYRVRVTARDNTANTTTRTRRLVVVAPRCRIRSRVVARFDVDGQRTTVTRLRVRGVPEGARVQARGPFGRRNVKRRGRTVNVLGTLKAHRTLRAGDRLVIRITKPGYIAKVVRFEIRSDRRPRKT